jgi:type III pantothenate kinase
VTANAGTDRWIVPQKTPDGKAESSGSLPIRPDRATAAGPDAHAGRYHPVMLLALDIGNTNITAGLVQGEAVVASRRASTRRASTADELEVLIDGLLRLDGATLADVTGISLASVVPSLTSGVEALAEDRGVPYLSAGAAIMPMPVRTEHPNEVGADRLVNALAVARLYGVPAIVVDFGTATTFDCVARDGAYVGGAIAAGLELQLEALASHTARLPRIELVEPAKAIGTDTISAMQSGIVLGYRAMTTGLLERLRLELARMERVDEQAIQIVITGGLSAAPWVKSLPGVDAIDPELTLKGLAILWALANGSPELPGESALGWTGSAAGSIHVISESDK